MSSTTKKTPIDPASKEYEDSLMTTSQMYRALSDFERSIKNENDIKKNRIANEIANFGNQYVEEIEIKHQIKEDERQDMVNFIIRNKKLDMPKVREIKNMPYEDVKSIYIKAKDEKKSWYRLLIEYLMGW